MTLSRGKQRRRRKTAKPLFSAKALVARNEFKKRSRKGERLRKGNQAVGTRFDIVIFISDIKKFDLVDNSDLLADSSIKN